MKTFAAGILTVFFLLSGPFAAHAGAIKGSVLNGTLDKKGMGDLEVTLFQYQNDKATEINRTRADQKGLYVFKDVQPQKDRKYYTAVSYKDVTYYSDALDFEQQNNPPNLDLAVFEPTDQDDHIRIKVHHILANVYEDGLAFNEIIVVENTGNTTYIGRPRADSGKNQTLQFSLPGGGSDIHPMTPSLVSSGNALIDTSAIIPGTRQIAFSYWVHPGAGTYRYEKRLNRQTQKFEMIFPDEGIRVGSDQLKIKTAEGNSGQHYIYLEGENLATNAQIAVELSRPRETKPFKWLITGLLTLVIGTAFSLSFLKTKKPQR
jgi:hypothetical protein